MNPLPILTIVRTVSLRNPESIMEAADAIWTQLCSYDLPNSLSAPDLPSVLNYRTWDNYDIVRPGLAVKFESDLAQLILFCARNQIPIN